jgi:hypothetical protein
VFQKNLVNSMLFAIPVLLSHVSTKNAAVKAGMKSSAVLDL